jgi:uncharacterized protein (TIGR02302 family)
VALARLVLGCEQVLPRLWPGIGFVALYFSLALFGLLPLLPWPVQSLALAATIIAAFFSWGGAFEDLSWPSWHDGARRLECDNQLAHRPISESGDRLISADPLSQSLWQWHLSRIAAPAALNITWPRIAMERRDPRNLRHLVLLALVAALLVALGEWQSRLSRAFDSGAGLAAGIEAWVDPPAYTGLPPVYLARDNHGPLRVPVGSRLNLRVHGLDHAPGLSLGGADAPRFTGDNGEYAAETRLVRDGAVKVRASGHLIGDWRLQMIPDHKPVIAFAAKPTATERAALTVAFKAGDDYGVTGAWLVIRPHGRGGKPVTVELPLAEASAKQVNQTGYFDLTGHPYAGLQVDAVLQARDGAGQVGESATVSFVLPARIFTDPLARALIEQRQNLATGGRPERARVARALNALTLAPEKFYENQTSLYLSLRAAYWGTRSARSDADLAHVEDLLWQIAVSLEHGGLLAAADELRRLQALLTQALAQHAPQSVIDALLQRYNEAMQRYLQALMDNPDKSGAKPDANAKQLGMGDLDALLKAIQQWSESGNRDMAAQALAMLQSMLENLHVQQGAGGNAQGNQALNQQIQKLGEMMGKQRALLDKTMRQRQGGANPKDGGPQGLAGQQGALKKEMDQALQGLDPKSRQAAGQAGQAMENAQRALAQGDLDNAGNEQKNALDALRKAADALAAEQNGKNGQAAGKEDPLGRSGGNGNGVKLPGASDMARAREILQELRKRAGERGRPQQELDYIDRLLKEF